MEWGFMLDPSSSHDADSARERLIDSAILGAILLMLAGVLALISWAGWPISTPRRSCPKRPLKICAKSFHVVEIAGKQAGPDVYFHGSPSSVAFRSSTTIRSGRGPA